MAYRDSFSAILAALLLGPLAGCSQDEGEPCQLDRDCADGLICDIGRGSSRGTCQDPADPGAGDPTTDGAMPALPPLPDELDAAAGSVDGGADAAAPAPDDDAGGADEAAG